MATPLSLLLFGATGYVGGTVLVDIRKAFPDITISALVRKDSDVAKVESLGVKVIRGSLSDTKVIEAAVLASDIVINAAAADDEEFISILLRSLTQRSKNSSVSRKPIFIHTSGALVYATDTDGKDDSNIERISDINESDIKNLDPSKLHVPVDRSIMKVGEEGQIDEFIICPPWIYGTGTGPVNRKSILFVLWIRAVLARKQCFYYGEGTNVWSAVHVKDLSNFYVTILKLALSGKDSNGPYSRYYFTTSEEFRMKNLAVSLGKALQNKGLLEDATPRSISKADVPDLPFLSWTGIANHERARRLSWSPAERQIVESIADDLDALLDGPIGSQQ